MSGGSDVRAEREQLGSVVTQPVTLPAPGRAMVLDERPELSRMVRDAQVTELMHDDVVQDVGRCEHEPPVERERAARRARAPERSLPSYADSAVRDADARRLLLGQRRDELSRGQPRLRLTDQEWIEAQSRHLATPLSLDPEALLIDQTLDAGATRSVWHGQPRRSSPWHFQSPSARPSRPPHLDSLHGARR